MRMINEAIENHADAREFVRRITEGEKEQAHELYVQTSSMNRQERRAEQKAIRAANRRAAQSKRKVPAK